MKQRVRIELPGEVWGAVVALAFRPGALPPAVQALVRAGLDTVKAEEEWPKACTGPCSPDGAGDPLPPADPA